MIAMASLADGATTRGGVGIGDDLALVRGRYEGVECGEGILGENHVTGETTTYPCYAEVGRVRVFFGDDPIHSITLTSRAMRTNW